MNWWRILRYRWRYGHWCTHESERGRLINAGAGKMFVCEDCERVTFA